MPGYVNDALRKFQHSMPKRLQYAPHKWTIHDYGQRIQYAPLPDASPPETSQEITCAQAIVDMLIYNDRDVYPALLENSGLAGFNIHSKNHKYCITSPLILQYSP
jgi:hypothetical protein